MTHMPQVGDLYPRKGGGFIKLHVGLNDEVSARIMADRYDVGYTTPMMPISWFWEQVGG